MDIMIKRRMGLGIATALSLCIFNGILPSSATAADIENDARAVTPDRFEREVVLNELHHINQKEIKVSTLAASQAQSPAVRSFANQMIKDHTKADSMVVNLAKNEQIDLASFQPADFEESAMSDLKLLKGAQFDQAFTAAMKSGHESALFFMKSAVADTRDAELKSLIKELIPTVQHHETLASNLAAQTSQMSGQQGMVN